MVKEMGTYTTASFLVLPKRPSAHDLCCDDLSKSDKQTKDTALHGNHGLLAYQLWWHGKLQRRNQALLLPGTVPVQSDRLQSRSEKERSPEPLDSPSTFLNIAIISKLMTIMRACFPPRKIRSVKGQRRPYGGGRQREEFSTPTCYVLYISYVTEYLRQIHMMDIIFILGKRKWKHESRFISFFSSKWHFHISNIQQ